MDGKVGVISASGLVKTFGGSRALDGMDLNVLNGEVHGLLGPNGAGKTTTIRILLGLVRASAGDVRVMGEDPWRHATELHRRLAYVPGDVTLWPNLTGGEVIDLLARLRGGFDPARKARLLARFDLDPAKRCRTYSKGNRQKVALVAAFASDVELLILDEPTSGLDPLMQSAFRDCVTEAKRAGCTILLSSHMLDEVQSLCDRVSIVRRGRRIADGALDELRSRSRIWVSVETEEPIPSLASFPDISDLTGRGLGLRFRIEASSLARLVREIAPFGVKALTTEEASLEDVFKTFYVADGDSDPAGAGEAKAGR